MAEWLLLRLPRAADLPAAWLRCDAHGFSTAGAESGSLEEAAAQAAGRRVCLIVSAADVLQTAVELPIKGGARTQQIVAYALEEQLVGDIEAQHFAVGRRNESGRTPVAVVARDIIGGWLAQLATVGVTPEAIRTDSGLLPRNPGHTVLLLEGDLLHAMPPGDDSQPVTLPADDLAAALHIIAGETDLSAMHLLLHVGAADWPRHSAQMEAMRPQLGSLKVQLLNSGLLAWLAPQAVAGQDINLLQGELVPRNSLRANWQHWRLAAVLALALLGLHVAAQGYALFQIRRAESSVDNSLQEIANRLGSAVSGNGSLRQRVQQRLTTQQNPGSTGLLDALQSLAGAVGAAPGTMLQALSYRDGTTDLKLRSSDAQSLERINQNLRGSGWNSELVSGSSVGNGYEGRITLRAGAAP